MLKRGYFLLARIMIGACSLLSAQTKFLTVEPNHSTVGFRIPISNGITLVTGKFTDFDLEVSLVDGGLDKIFS
jgi:polyisoprenoid-binding protein YceI